MCIVILAEVPQAFCEGEAVPRCVGCKALLARLQLTSLGEEVSLSFDSDRRMSRYESYMGSSIPMTST